MGRTAWRGLWLLALAGVALAQQAFVPLEQRLGEERMREIGLSADQLALLNRYLRESEAAAPARPLPMAAAAMPDTTRFAGMEAQQLATRVRGTVAGWEPGTVFVLENGQQWKVLKGRMTLRKPLEHPPVLLVPGVAGRWFLQVHEDLPKARVYRID